MKRYKPKMFRKNPVTKEIITFEDYRVHNSHGKDHIGVMMKENIDGGWVKWADVENILGDNEGILSEVDSIKCTCEEMVEFLKNAVSVKGDAVLIELKKLEIVE